MADSSYVGERGEWALILSELRLFEPAQHVFTPCFKMYQDAINYIIYCSDVNMLETCSSEVDEMTMMIRCGSWVRQAGLFACTSQVFERHRSGDLMEIWSFMEPISLIFTVWGCLIWAFFSRFLFTVFFFYSHLDILKWMFCFAVNAERDPFLSG